MAFSEAEIVQAISEDIQKGWDLQYHLARQRMARIAYANRAIDSAFIDGLGAREMSVDPYIYHMWGQKYGYQIWQDKAFRDSLKRDNPEVKVSTKSKKIQVGYR